MISKRLSSLLVLALSSSLLNASVFNYSKADLAAVEKTSATVDAAVSVYGLFGGDEKFGELSDHGILGEVLFYASRVKEFTGAAVESESNVVAFQRLVEALHGTYANAKEINGKGCPKDWGVAEYGVMVHGLLTELEREIAHAAAVKCVKERFGQAEETRLVRRALYVVDGALIEALVSALSKTAYDVVSDRYNNGEFESVSDYALNAWTEAKKSLIAAAGKAALKQVIGEILVSSANDDTTAPEVKSLLRKVDELSNKVMVRLPTKK